MLPVFRSPLVGDHPQNSAETWEDSEHSDLHERCEPMLNSTWAGSWLWKHPKEWVNHNESRMWLSVSFLEPDQSSSTLSFHWTDCLPPGTAAALFWVLIPVAYLEEVRRCALYSSGLSQTQKPESFGRKDGVWWSTFYAWLGAYAELENCIFMPLHGRGRPHRNQRFARLRCSSGNVVLVCQNHVFYRILFHLYKHKTLVCTMFFVAKCKVSTTALFAQVIGPLEELLIFAVFPCAQHIS